MQEQNKIVMWAVIENIVTILIASGLFIYTQSAWCFLLLLNLNMFKTKK